MVVTGAEEAKEAEEAEANNITAAAAVAAAAAAEEEQEEAAEEAGSCTHLPQFIIKPSPQHSTHTVSEGVSHHQRLTV